MAPGLLVEVQARHLWHDIGVLWQEEQQDGVSRVLLERTHEVAQHRTYDLRPERIEEIDDEILVGKIKLCSISMDGLDGSAPPASRLISAQYCRRPARGGRRQTRRQAPCQREAQRRRKANALFLSQDR